MVMLSPNLQHKHIVRAVAGYSSPSLIVPHLRNREPAAVVGELCSTLEHAGRLTDPLSFFNAVISHEMISSTVCSPGWAMPHGRVRGLPQLSLAVGRCAGPISWFAPGAAPVQMVFLFAVPEDQGAAYLALLSAMAKLSQNRLLLDKLAQAADSQGIFDILQQIPLRQSPSVVHGN